MLYFTQKKASENIDEWHKYIFLNSKQFVLCAGTSLDITQFPSHAPPQAN